MIKSMTGYGTAAFSNDSVEIRVEVKSLNSKFLDTSIRVGRAYSEKEIDIRNKASVILVRGKVSISIEVQSKTNDQIAVSYNESLFKAYYHKLYALTDGINATGHDIFKLALQSPDVIVGQSREAVSGDEWQFVENVLIEALQKCDDHRIDEGNVLMNKLTDYIKVIANGLEEVVKLDPDRVKQIRTRIEANIGQFVEEEKIDKNRLEQELIYYIEKLDLSEEKVRLANHLNYFTEVMNQSDSNGKKLGFIAQEIGREINTIGSKANDAEIQKAVVEMKDELEKIKEQVLNVL